MLDPVFWGGFIAGVVVTTITLFVSVYIYVNAKGPFYVGPSEPPNERKK